MTLLRLASGVAIHSSQQAITPTIDGAHICSCASCNIGTSDKQHCSNVLHLQCSASPWPAQLLAADCLPVTGFLLLPCLQVPWHLQLPVAVAKWVLFTCLGCMVDQQLLGSCTAGWTTYASALAALLVPKTLAVLWFQWQTGRSASAASAAETQQGEASADEGPVSVYHVSAKPATAGQPGSSSAGQAHSDAAACPGKQRSSCDSAPASGSLAPSTLDASTASNITFSSSAASTATQPSAQGSLPATLQSHVHAMPLARPDADIAAIAAPVIRPRSALFTRGSKARLMTVSIKVSSTLQLLRNSNLCHV